MEIGNTPLIPEESVFHGGGILENNTGSQLLLLFFFQRESNIEVLKLTTIFCFFIFGI